MRKPLDYSALLRLLARTWNVAHGRTQPDLGVSRLEEMVRLVTSDDVDIIALQEVPVSALRSLARWSGMQAYGAVAMRSYAGAFGRWVTFLDPARLRSALTGQTNAILLGPALETLEAPRVLALNPRDVRAGVGRSLGLERRVLARWARNRRVCQAVRVRAHGTTMVIANMHLTHFDTRLAEAELTRAEALASQLCGTTAPTLLAGDLNIPGAEARIFDPLVAAGYTRPAGGIDHLLASNMTLGRGPEALADSVRTHDGIILSDHPIVEATFEVQV